MTAPIAFMAVISWAKHPFKKSAVVEVSRLSKNQKNFMWFFALLCFLLTICMDFSTGADLKSNKEYIIKAL